MPILLFAIVVGLTLYGLAAPDPWTLRTTRGAAGAIGAIRSDRSSQPRSTQPRSSRSGRSTGARTHTYSGAGRSVAPKPPSIPFPSRRRSKAARSSSPIARSIRGWIDSADRAEKRRGETRAAIGELLARSRARRLQRQIAQAEREAYVEDELRARAEQRARTSDGAQAVAEAVTQHDPAPTPPAPPAQPRGAAVPEITHTTVTELDTLDQFAAEVRASFQAADQITDGIAELATWFTNLPERYRGATDLYKTDRMNASVALMHEEQISFLQTRFGDIAGRLHTLLKAIEKAQADATESEARSGRVETARPN